MRVQPYRERSRERGPCRHVTPPSYTTRNNARNPIGHHSGRGELVLEHDPQGAAVFVHILVNPVEDPGVGFNTGIDDDDKTGEETWVDGRIEG